MIRHRKIEIETREAMLYEFTDNVRAIAAELATGEGMLTLFVRHTSCSLLIQENADPDVVRPFRARTPVSLSIPVAGGRPMLGTWQGVYLFEHRDAPMRRTVIASLAA